MIESPLIQELWAEKAQEYITDVLAARFGTTPPEITLALRSITDVERLRELNRLAAVCADIESFQSHLSP